jgi:hypothetical protein
MEKMGSYAMRTEAGRIEERDMVYGWKRSEG